MNRFKRIKSRKPKGNAAALGAIKAYINFMIAKGAKEIRIDTKDGFSIATDNGLSKEELESKEFQILVSNLQKALSR